MSWKDKHIKELFDNAPNRTMKPTLQQWEMLSSKLAKKGFFQFGFDHFNIYWLGFAVGLGLAIFLVMPKKNNPDRLNLKEKEIEITDTLPGKQETQKNNLPEYTSDPSQKTVLPNNTKPLNPSSEKISDSIPGNTCNTINPDSLKNKDDSLTFIKKDQVIQKKTKVSNVVVVKQNTIYVEDSVTKSKKQSTQKKSK